jgi:arylsulfatase A-like enzyme
MNRRTRNLLLFALVLLVLGGYLFYPLASQDYEIVEDEQKIAFKKQFLTSAQPDTGKRPNIILILADDLGKTDISLYGSTFVQTPHIDSIGYQGVICSDGYVTAPICSPSRAGLLTGRYQQRFGHELQPIERRYPRNRFEFNTVKYFYDLGDMRPNPAMKYPPQSAIEKQGLLLSEITLAELLRANGYATALIGKWHLGHSSPYVPINRGFDYQYGFYASHSLYAEVGNPAIIEHHRPEFIDKLMWESGREGTHAIRRNNQTIEEKAYLTEKIAQEATQFLEKNQKKPFFLYLPFNAPHTPLQAPQKYYDQFSHIQDPNRRVYYAMIKALDDAVGQIMQKLRALGLEENTLIYFASDNGGATYTQATTNAPLKCGKFSNFEGGLNVPFMVKWKGKIAAGTRFSHPVSALDFFVTSASVARAKLPTDRVYDGVDLMPYLLGKQANAPHPILFWRSGYNKAARKGQWKLIMDTENQKIMLFDLAKDKSEKNNLANQFPEKVKELQNDLQNWEQNLAKPLWPSVMSYKFVLEDGTYWYAL